VDTGFDSARLNSVFAFRCRGARPSCSPGRRSGVLREDDAHRRGPEHEGLLTGHPSQAGVRHDRVRVMDTPLTLEKAAGSPPTSSRSPMADRGAPGRAGRGRLSGVHVQPLPGLPIRIRRRLRRPKSGGHTTIREHILATMDRSVRTSRNRGAAACDELARTRARAAATRAAAGAVRGRAHARGGGSTPDPALQDETRGPAAGSPHSEVGTARMEGLYNMFPA